MHRRQRDIRPPVLLAALLMALAGCGGRASVTTEPPPPGPLVMNPDSAAQARQWYAQWATEPALAGDTVVRHAFVFGQPARTGRTGESRVTCRLVLQDAAYKPIRRDGPIRIVMVAAPDEPQERVVGAWSLDTTTAGEHYRYGIMPGYLLDLYWPRVADVSTYQLVVRWSDPAGRAHVITTFHFEDVFGYDLQTTPNDS